MSFLGLVGHNVWMKKVRSLLTALAVAVGVMTVVTLGIVTESIKTTAAGILQVGAADFAVAQKSASDILLSTVTTNQLDQIRQTPGVKSAIGVLLDTEKLNDQNPLFIEIGIDPADLVPFGVHIVDGRPFDANANDEMMLGYQIAEDLGIKVGDTLDVAGGPKTVTGLFSVGNVFGNSAGMFPLVPFQAHERKPEGLSLLFVKADPDTSIPALTQRIRDENHNLTTVRTLAQFGRADRNYQLISAADSGATILAVVIGAIIVMNVMLLSLLERTREFGVMRSIGWTRRRLVALIMGEAAVMSFVGAAVGVGLSYLLTRILARLPDLEGILQPHYSATTFFRALIVAAVVALLGALYPALRAAFLSPLEALRHE